LIDGVGKIVGHDAKPAKRLHVAGWKPSLPGRRANHSSCTDGGAPGEAKPPASGSQTSPPPPVFRGTIWWRHTVRAREREGGRQRQNDRRRAAGDTVAVHATLQSPYLSISLSRPQPSLRLSFWLLPS